MLQTVRSTRRRSIMASKMKLSDIKPNETNPRDIAETDLNKLVQSIKDFPEMLEVRPLILNKDHVILGGNMRFRAAQKAGVTELPVEIVDWSEEKQREFIIKDNVSGGDWDWDILANEWDLEQLQDWGLHVKGTNDPQTEWADMPEYNQGDEMAHKRLIVNFENEEDVQEFAKLVSQNVGEKTRYIWFPEQEKKNRKDYEYKE